MTAKKFLREKIKVGDRELSVEIGRVAKQASGAVVIRSGDTMLLVAAVGANQPREGIDFFPLTVEYREHNYAAGRIPGNYFRREGRPGEKEVLTARMIDRPCRPLFSEGYRNETQVIASVISADDENDPDVVAITGASCALYLSDIPFPNPIAGVRVGLVNGRYVINPTYDEVRESRINLIVAGTEEAIVMVEAGAKEVSESHPQDQPDPRQRAKEIHDHLKEKIFRERILGNRRRPDNRRFSEIRPIDVEVGWLPRVHGSALFTRGETQGIVTATLGTKEDEQFMDDLESGEIKRRFLLHYNFPHFSVGEVGRFGSTSRREIGHGALARRALEPVLPTEAEFPYSLRIVSDITESNGSSSMATVCGGSLSMMDAGVPIKAAVAGVAMGLVMEGNRYAILSDIAGAEDHYGDMDFKVAGTSKGITALQMDI